MNRLFLILIVFFISLSLSSSEVFILKPKVKGKIPQTLKNLPDIPVEFQKLTQFYLDYFYNFSLSLQANSDFFYPIQKSDFKKMCFSKGADFILADSFFFDSLLVLTRNLFDCRLSELKENRYTFNENLFSAIKQMNDSSFLSIYKKRDIIETISQKIKGVTYIILHNTLSFQRELKEVIQFLKRQNLSSNTKFLIIEKNKYRLLNSSTNISSILDFKNSIKSPSSKELFEGIYRLKPYIQDNDRFFIFTNAKVENMNQNYLSHFSFFRKAKVYLILGNYYGVQSYNFHKGFVKNSSNTTQFDISYYRKIVFPESSFYLIAKANRLYERNTIKNNLSFFQSLEQTNLYLYKSGLKNLTPLNFTYHYEKISQRKIIAAYSLNNNLNLILKKIFPKNIQKLRPKYKYLVKTDKSAFWFFSNEKYKNNPFVTLKTSYKRSQNLNLQNDPRKTKKYELSIPKLLICDMKKIQTYFNRTNESNFECILKGKIIDSNEL